MSSKQLWPEWGRTTANGRALLKQLTGMAKLSKTALLWCLTLPYYACNGCCFPMIAVIPLMLLLLLLLLLPLLRVYASCLCCRCVCTYTATAVSHDTKDFWWEPVLTCSIISKPLLHSNPYTAACKWCLSRMHTSRLACAAGQKRLCTLFLLASKTFQLLSCQDLALCDETHMDI